MIIGVNAKYINRDGLDKVADFTWEVVQQLAHNHPEHQFHLFFDRNYPSEYLFGTNVIGHIVSPAASHPLLWKYWFDIAIPRQLKKIKADAFLSFGGVCSLFTKVPQCLVIHDLRFLHHPKSYKRSLNFYYKVNVAKYLKKASTIACLSEYTRKELLDQYKVQPSKITVVYSAIKSIFKPKSEVERQAVKDKYCEGAEFFIYAGPFEKGENLVSLLKAFSIFKKRLQSGMKLVLARTIAKNNEELTNLLNSYKYKDDVILTGNLEQQDFALLLASCYALIYASLFEGFGSPALEAMNCDVPVLTYRRTAGEEITADAALYFNPSNVNEIAQQLMLIYKDESLRRSLIEKGRVVASEYSWERTGELIWKSLKDAASKSN